MFRKSLPHDRLIQGAVQAAALSLTLVTLAACASAPPPGGGSLTSYAGLASTGAHRTQASARSDAAPLGVARTLRIDPVTFAADAQSNATPAQQTLIANTMARALCRDLDRRYQILTGPGDADLTVRTVVTRIRPTNAGAAALSAAASWLVPVPRLPIGLGGFAAEAEAVGPNGEQAAAMVWSRDADVFSGKRVSSIGDAYDLSTRFTHDLGKLLIRSADPATLAPRGKAGRGACETYGKGPGLTGALAGLLGAPPKWTDGKRPRA